MLQNASIIKHFDQYRLRIPIADDTHIIIADDFTTLAAFKAVYNNLPLEERRVFIEHLIKEKMSS